MKTIALISNSLASLYNFRYELILELKRQEYHVVLFCPICGDDLERKMELEEKGCEFQITKLEGTGTNPLTDFRLCLLYQRLLKKVRPDLVITYTIKPNIYGGMICQMLGIPYFSNVTGLGRALENEGVLQKMTILLYRMGLKKSRCVFFQNTTNRDYMIEHGVTHGNEKLVPGSGVNLEQFRVLPYPGQDTIEFVMIARVMKDKGIDEYLEAATYITANYPQSRFHICGLCEENYRSRIEEFVKREIIQYHGVVKDMTAIFEQVHCAVLPSYHEGMSNALLEAQSCGRPVIASNIHGCRETFDEGITGFGVPIKDAKALIRKIEQFIDLTKEEKEKMGLAGRKKMEQEFNRTEVVATYINEMEKVIQS